LNEIIFFTGSQPGSYQQHSSVPGYAAGSVGRGRGLNPPSSRGGYGTQPGGYGTQPGGYGSQPGSYQHQTQATNTNTTPMRTNSSYYAADTSQYQKYDGKKRPAPADSAGSGPGQRRFGDPGSGAKRPRFVFGFFGISIFLQDFLCQSF
jgi:hypothetical protein